MDCVPVPLVRRRVRAHSGAAEELGELGREPRPDVHAVRHVPDARRLAGPERCPHVARDLAVQLGNAVRGRREAQRERRQSEAVGAVRTSELQQRTRGEPCEACEVAGLRHRNGRPRVSDFCKN